MTDYGAGTKREVSHTLHNWFYKTKLQRLFRSRTPLALRKGCARYLEIKFSGDFSIKKGRSRQKTSVHFNNGVWRKNLFHMGIPAVENFSSKLLQMSRLTWYSVAECWDCERLSPFTSRREETRLQGEKPQGKFHRAKLTLWVYSCNTTALRAESHRFTLLRFYLHSSQKSDRH